MVSLDITKDLVGADIASGVERLIAPDQMGSLFKVLCLTQAGLPQPPGFED